MAPAVGERIRLRRQQLGLRQEDLAARVGASPSAVLAWEKDRYFPKRHQGAVEEVLGISLTGSGGEPDPEEEALRALGTERGGFLKPDEVDWILSVYRLRKRPRAG